MDEILPHILFPRDGDDGASRGQRALVVTAVLTAISILVVGMRMYARIGLLKMIGREDYTILFSLVLAIVYLALVAAQVHFGLGTHNSALSDEELKQQLKRLWAAIPFYNASLALTKFSILFQYLRIFPDRRFRMACWVVMGVVALYGTWAVVSAFVNCVPVAKFWDRTIAGSCLSFEAVWFFNASMNIVTDLTLLIMPMPLLSQLQLPRLQKFALMGVFAIGGLVVITSILRLSSLRAVAKDPDTSYSNVGASYWTAAECNVAIICACLPFLRPIVSCLFPKLLSTQSYNHYTRNPTATVTTRSRATRMHLPSQNDDFGMCTIDVEQGERRPDDAFKGIEVTTEMYQETSKNDESTSQRRLVMES
ncbi:PTH11-like integral membrane protein [Aspergillus nomiae NRRL 13137]|uniref:PTH11-like integral membrane protein n=1 Tax=Aspergillus nomiae NRRL (strain ATCC 15546 / NRRL 13137 / CBS 260.88 / M93) TaxID=1509407 RepID=A0A0L1IN45_ASPN3|nr:PTH11-like integral membrane protein [Aspergillus nomiae NRRL 13137]KNG80939.1 PTH11-like integral membrane protein [Aspergillus nomiae NRRL 13137]